MYPKSLHWAIYDERNGSLLNLNGVCQGNYIKMKDEPAAEAYVKTGQRRDGGLEFRYLGVFATVGEAKREIERFYI